MWVPASKQFIVFLIDGPFVLRIYLHPSGAFPGRELDYVANYMYGQSISGRPCAVELRAAQPSLDLSALELSASLAHSILLPQID
jgi:hypothetical protein